MNVLKRKQEEMEVPEVESAREIFLRVVRRLAIRIEQVRVSTVRIRN